jgi:hypothetical protein
VFTPHRPNLYTLNATAWLVLELCDGKDGAALEAAYHRAMGREPGQPDSATELHEIVADFERKGIVERRQMDMAAMPAANDSHAGGEAK